MKREALASLPAELLRRWAPAALAVFLTSALLAGCAATSGGSDDAARAFPEFLQGVKQQAPVTAPRSEGFQRGVLETVDDDRLAEQAAVSGFCGVATEVVNSGQPRTEEAWLDGMRAQVREDNPDAIAILAEDKLEQVRATGRLAEINPQLAARYVQSCK